MTQQEEIQIIRLFDVQNHQYVAAEFRNFISDANLNDWQTRWLPEQYRLMIHLINTGENYKEHIDSSKWNWRRKVSVLRLNPNQRGFSLIYEGVTQAMMIVDVSKKCKHPDQLNKNLVYIEFIQVAPWNNRKLNENLVKFKGVGNIMFQKAIEFSKKMLWSGRVGLHSLQSTEGFYQKAEMTNLGVDIEYEGLTYFEMTLPKAEYYLDKENQE